MTSKEFKQLIDYLEIKYPYSVTEDDGEYVVSFPDLPGCITQVEDPAEINEMAIDAKSIWLETAFESGDQIPEGPAQDFSGKFMVRIPKSLHRDLTYQAREEGMSLNAFILHLLSERSIQSRIESLVKSSETVEQRAHQSRRPQTTYTFGNDAEVLGRYGIRRSSGDDVDNNRSVRSSRTKYTFEGWATDHRASRPR